ncbi:MAG: hypothetical protein Q7R87_04810 [Nanoarchaeota archaeon]|nr:hypothetical protein [Nanoarchaeota archaeon]
MNKRGDLEVKKLIGYGILILFLFIVCPLIYMLAKGKLPGLGASLKNIIGLG